MNPCPTCNNTGVRIDHLALAAVDAAIVEYVKAEVRKCDNIARYIKSCDEHATAKRREAERLTHEARLDEDRRDRVKSMVLQIMRDVGKKKIEGATYTLSRVGNGGVQAVEVVQPDLVPNTLRKTTIVMPLELWRTVCKQVNQDTIDRLVCESRSNPEPDLTAIRKELEKRVPCPKCVGCKLQHFSEMGGDGPGQTIPCSACGGTGEVANGVPGCVLKPRGESLRIK